MKKKSDYIKELEDELLEEYVIPEKKEDDTSKTGISKNMSDKSGIDKRILKVKRKISGIRGIKPIEEFPYDINEFDRIDFEYDNLVIKGKKSYYRYAIIALLALGAVTLKKNPALQRMIERNLNIENTLDLSNDEEVLKITAIDYQAIPNDGWGDGIMLTSNGYHLLMDTFSSLCKESLYKYLRDNNINEFDIYISHNHGDHHGNLMSLINDYKVSKVYLPNLSSFDKSAKDIEEKGIRVIRLKEGDTFEIGSSNCVGEVLFGPESFEECKNDVPKLINNQSLVTMIRAKTKSGDVKYLTGGDIEEIAANDILAQGINIKADIMKADHHGGGDTPEYISKVDPSYFICDFCRSNDEDWVKPQLNAADKCGNVLSSYNNGEISLSIKGSGEIVPTLGRNYEPVKFEVKDKLGNTYTVAYDLNNKSSHILTDRMEEAARNKVTTTKLTKNNNIFEKIAQGIGYGFENIKDMVDGNNEKGEGKNAEEKDTELEGAFTIDLPEGLGRVKSYEAWDYPRGNVGSEWAHGTGQYRLWKEADGLNSFDSNGFGVVNGSYVVAVTTTFGKPGDFIQVELEDGTIIPCIIGDIKSQKDPGCNKYGHRNGQSVIEFMGKTSKWYYKGYGDKTKEYRQEWYNKAVVKITNTGVSYFENKEFTNNISAEEKYLVEDTLKYACSWVGKVPYKSHANGHADNGERKLPLQKDRGSDCSWFVYWVFKETGLIKKDQGFIHSEDWGKGGADGGCPGTVKIGTDLSQASPGDVLWWKGNSGKSWDHHVAIYLGNGKKVECGYIPNDTDKDDGVKITETSQDDGFKQILHFKQLPKDPTGYFDPETNTLHSSVSKSSGNNVKIPFLQGKEEEKTENDKKMTFEEFQKELWTDKTIAIFDSEGTRGEWLNAINAKGTNGESGGTTLYAVNGSKPIDFYNKFKNNEDFLKGKKHILVEVGPNDLGDWNSMENLLNLLVERKDPGAKIYLEQIESTSGGSQSVIDAFNQHLKEYESTHDDCYYIETRATPNNLKDENGKVKPELCDSPGLHFLEGKGTYEKWAENTAYAIYEIYQREKELEFMGIKIDPDNDLYDAAKMANDIADALGDIVDDWMR